MKNLTRNMMAVVVLIVLISFAPEVNAQCAMCSATAESAVRNGKNQAGFGLNDGILYLLATPYLLFGIFGSIWYFNYRKKKKAASEEASI